MLKWWRGGWMELGINVFGSNGPEQENEGKRIEMVWVHQKEK